MRKWTLRAVAGCLVAGLVLGSALFAVAASSPKTSKGQDGGIEIMKNDLELTEEQTAQLSSLREKLQEKVVALREKIADDLQNIQAKLKAGATDAELKPLVKEYYADRKAEESLRQKQIDDMQTLLTPTQQAKWLVQMSRPISKASKKKK